MKKSYIWPLINRLSHLLLIIFLVVAYFSGSYKRYLDYHVAFGYAMGLLFLFRFIWGFIGPKYSKFRDFDFKLKDLVQYMSSVFVKTKEYIGHNPASSYAIVAMMILSVLVIISGATQLGIQKNHGFLSFLHVPYFQYMELISKIHWWLANTLIVMILTHVAGSLIDKFIKKSDAIDSMISGYKSISKKIDIRLNTFQKTFGAIWILVSLLSLFYIFYDKNNVLVASANIKQDYALQHRDFAKECGDCHMVYPPFLLPKKSWTVMMKNLDNHFGEDASLDKPTNLSILAFLKANSAQNSKQETAFKILKSLKDDNNTVIAVTKTPYWKKIHKKIDKNIFKNPKIKSKANCKACHKNIENGLIEDNLIKIPALKG
jgi:cytochrome b